MFHRGLRRIGVAVFILAVVAAPAQARENGWRDLERVEARGFLGHFQNALRGLFAFARGGMDPNGES
jgi:hypothetical protein